MDAKSVVSGLAVLIGLVIMQVPMNPTAAQDFSRFQCPTLAELRMDMLVRYRYCPRDPFHARRFVRESARCDESLDVRQVEQQILNSPRKPEDAQNFRAIMGALRQQNCDF